MMIIITVVYLCFATPDIISMFKEKVYVLIWLYLGILTITYTFCILIALDVKIPSPQPLIKTVITSILGPSAQ